MELNFSSHIQNLLFALIGVILVLVCRLSRSRFRYFWRLAGMEGVLAGGWRFHIQRTGRGSSYLSGVNAAVLVTLKVLSSKGPQ